VLRNLSGRTDKVRFGEISLDFKKLPKVFSTLTGAWFRNVSPNIRSEGFTGDAIQGEERVRFLLEQSASTHNDTSLSAL
jgi:hypothetical protein